MTGTDVEPAAETAWVPVEACRLPGDDQATRLEAFAELFAASLEAVERAEPTRLRLTLTHRPAVAAHAADLATREADCCGFFTFTLTVTRERLVMDVTVPDAHSKVLDGLAAQAEEARKA